MAPTDKKALRRQVRELTSSRNSLISNRARLESLSMEFLVKAQRALKSGDESLAKEALQLKRAQTEASHDVLLHVDMEKKSLQRLNKNLLDYQYIKDPSKKTLIEPPVSIPRTAALKFSYVPSALPAPIIESWANAFSKETQNYESFAVYAESKLQEAIHHGYQNQGGNHAKVDPGIPAVCIDLMLKMGNSAFGFRFAPLIRLLSTQLIRCIYNINNDPSTTISNEELDSVTLRWLFAQKPYFLSSEEVSKERDRLKEVCKTEASGRNIKKILDSRNAGIKLLFDKHQVWMRKIIFSTWKGFCSREKAKRMKFLRYQKNKWMRRWKNVVFAGSGGGASENNGGSAAMDSEERSWQKRFRTQEKEKQRMQDQIEELKEQLYNNQHELGMAYELINELQPHLSNDFIGQQSAAEKRKSAMRDLGLESKRRESAAAIYRTSKFTVDITHWKGKVKEKMEQKKLEDAELAVFSRSKVVHHSTKCQTDLSGSVVHENVRQRKRASLVNKAGRKTAAIAPLAISDIIDVESKAPKLNSSTSFYLISLLLEGLCHKYQKLIAGHHQSTFAVKDLPHPAIPEFFRDILIKKYGVHSLALKYLTSLCALSVKDEEVDPLFKIFNELTSLSTRGNRMFKQDHFRFDVFLLVKFLLLLCPDKKPSAITSCLCDEDGRSWDRESICTSIHKNFPNLRVKSPVKYKEFLERVTSLPVTTLKGKEKEPRTPLDSVIIIVMEYVEEERFARSEKPSKDLIASSLSKIRPHLVRYTFNHHAKRQDSMRKFMEVFKEWDVKLHRHSQERKGNQNVEEVAISGALRLEEFSEMVRASLKFEPSKEELLRMFLEWHELIEVERKAAGFAGTQVGDEIALMNLDKSSENIHVLVDAAEKEMEDAYLLLERKATIEKMEKRKGVVLFAMGNRAGQSILIPESPLPPSSKVHKNVRLLQRKIKRRFMESGFNDNDGITAQEMESRLGGYRFGEAAFVKLMWNYRIGCV
mmetsp:Transcript_15491/g.31919  ORF Transcript_15491/g.31919 Transcript_15491/m.31919 type:complete len:986 (-) Transcript_15491:57-3014(-)